MTDQKKNDLFENLVAISIQPMAVIRNRRYEYVNAAFTRVFGYSRDDVARGMDMFALVPEQDRARDMDAMTCSDQPIRYSFDASAKDGTRIPCDATAQLIRDGADNVLLATFREKHSASALRASERKFRNIVEGSPMGMHLYTLEPDGRLVFTGANPAADRLLKVANAQFIGKTIEEAFPPLAETDVPEQYREVARTGNAWFTEQIEYDEGAIKGAFEVYAFQTEPGRMAAAFLDVTEQKRYVEALKQAREDWENIFQAIGSPTVILSTDHIIKAANKAAVAAIGLPINKIIGKHCYDYFHSPATTPETCPLRRITASPHYEAVEMEMEALGGTYLVSCTPILDQTGALESIIHIATNISDRKAAEDLLAESERKYRTLIESSIQGIVLFHPAGIEYVNPALERMLGYSSDELRNGDIQSVVQRIIHPDDQSMLLDNITARMEGRDAPARYEVRMLNRQQQLLWADINATRVDYHGQRGILSFITDITDRKRAEQALRESENRYRTIFENAGEGILIADAKTRTFRYANPMIARMLGHTERELCGMDVTGIHPPADVPGVLDLFEKQYRQKLSVATDVPCMRKDGTVFYADISAAPAVMEGRECSVGFFTDVTVRYEAQAALRASEAYLRSVFRAAPTGIGVVINRTLAQINERVCEMTGYTADELVGQNARILYPTQEDYEYVGTEKYRQIRAGGSGTVETRWQRKDGTVIDVLLSSTPIDADDHGKGVAFTALDITERTGMLRKLQASVHEKDILLKEVHHRVKNNLQIISSLLSLQSKYLQDPRDLELFTDSRNRVRSMALIHEQLYRNDDVAEINFRDYINSIAAELARAYASQDRRIALDLDIGDVHVGLNQAIPCGLIINELLSNAFKHAFPENRPVPDARITVTFNTSGPAGMFRLIVADNGTGLPDDIDFEATDSLGMHLVRLLVEEQLEGSVEIAGDDGTAFTITFASPA